MKTTKQKKKEFKAFIKGLEKQGLELLDNGHACVYDISQTLREKESNEWKEYEPTGNKMILVGICPRYYQGIMAEKFQELSKQFRDK